MTTSPLAAAEAESRYRRRAMEQLLGEARHFEDQPGASEEEFHAFRDNWLAPQCAVLKWYLDWLGARGVGVAALEPFLEVGAFTAHLSGWLATTHGLRGTCSDLEDAVVRRSIERLFPRLGMSGARLAVAPANCERLPFDNGSFGFVFAFSAVHHFEDARRCLREIRRVLRPGGVFLCAWEPLQPLMRRSRRPVGRSEVREGLIENVYTLPEWDGLMASAFDRFESMPYSDLRTPFAAWRSWWPGMVNKPQRRRLRRAILSLLGGQDYSAACFA